MMGAKVWIVEEWDDGSDATPVVAVFDSLEKAEDYIEKGKPFAHRELSGVGDEGWTVE